jgi:signal transduction histidine kinase
MRSFSDDSPRVASPRALAPSRYAVPGAVDVAGDLQSASQRLRALAALSGSLTDALAPEDAANLVERHALSLLGASSAVIATLGVLPAASVEEHAASDSSVASAAVALPLVSSLLLVHAIGVPAEVRAALKQLPLDAPVPLAEVAREGEAVFLKSRDEMRRYPDWSAAMIRAGAQAAAVVPVWANGELRGVLGLTWDVSREFTEDDRAFIITLGVMCAQAILRSHLRVAEQRARETAEHANRSKAHFLATISHELRTPINAVMGYTQLLVEEIYGPMSALQKDHLGRVRASGKHLLELVEELLGYARIEAGEEVVRPELVLLADVVEQSLVLVRPLAEAKRLQIRLEGHDAPLELFTDVRKLRQILVNLLANAIKYTESGDIVLLVHIGGVGTDPRVYFEVTDTGRGIAVEDHEHIFDAFWQEDHTMTHGSGSTGLGLSVARQLARLLGGDVLLARSKLARGSTFVVSLPASFATIAAATTGLLPVLHRRRRGDHV